MKENLLILYLLIYEYCIFPYEYFCDHTHWPSEVDSYMNIIFCDHTHPLALYLTQYSTGPVK